MEYKHIKLKVYLMKNDKIYRHIMARFRDKNEYIFTQAFDLNMKIYFDTAKKIEQLRKEIFTS